MFATSMRKIHFGARAQARRMIPRDVTRYAILKRLMVDKIPYMMMPHIRTLIVRPDTLAEAGQMGCSADLVRWLYPSIFYSFKRPFGTFPFAI